MKEVTCPACGAIMESDDEEGLISAAQMHSKAGHGYDLPREHVLANICDAPDE